ncbi:MAG: aminotransferase class IV family protein [Phycisphaerales bacterium]|nr:aminotransferase class IV family protein [Phycisphaerales bacterium]
MVSVYLNGAMVSAADARVSAFDAALQHGVGLFETMLAVREAAGPARVLHLHEHLARLRGSALGLGLAQTLHLGPLGEAVQRTVAHAAGQSPDQKRWRVRLTLTGGDLNLLARPGGAHQPTLLIVAQPATEYPAAMFERGALVLLADLRVSPLDPMQGHKTPAYWGRLRELQAAAAKKADEALVFSITNHLCGGCVSNAFVVKDGVLMTPIARGEEEEVAAGDDGPTDAPLPRGPAGAVLPSPVLPGVVRRWVLDWALSEGVPCRRRMLTLDDLLAADEVFLTNSSWGVLPVAGLEAHRVGQGVGEVGRSLVEAWGELAT